MTGNRHIQQLQWLLCSIVTMLLAACYAYDAEEVEGAQHKQTKLAIYVYAPEVRGTRCEVRGTGCEVRGTRCEVRGTRADVGKVEAIANEGTITSLQIWIYESESGAYVGYLSTDEVAALNEGQGTTYQIPVSDEFAATKPDVNVYVLANVTNNNCGVGVLGKETSRDALLEGAKITGHFGLDELVRSVPADGLPMAGKLTTQPVVGDAPALRIGTMAQVATVPLTRAVSKLRFVFSKTKDEPTVHITSIKMNEGMVPSEEYFFKTPITMTYNTEKAELLSHDISDIAEAADPTNFLFFNQDAQDYEDLIDEAASKATPEVTLEGPIYLRESDKQLKGTITYTIGTGDPQTTDFAMQQAGDFMRNHTWIVYAYYAGSGNLQVESIYVKEWTTKEINHDIYNW